MENECGGRKVEMRHQQSFPPRILQLLFNKLLSWGNNLLTKESLTVIQPQLGHVKKIELQLPYVAVFPLSGNNRFRPCQSR
jgi:hypothetical protein